MARDTHVVKKAQQQLDGVLGGERLPEHSDMDQLPYITAVIKETFRWAPPIPVGIPHRLMEDDVYREMSIPAGATVMENIWSVHYFSRDGTSPDVPGRATCYDRNVYPDPETFNPERFLTKDGKIDPSVKDPEARIFGSGRRWAKRWDLRLRCAERQ